MSTMPTVYFIDDSATMREVIKIAFRRENINVVACHDAAAALAEIESTRPDIVITDVIMPDKDGYDVCEYIKSHAELSKIPVVLMSGVVNRAVAERAFAVKADELLRKPFQPQDLITRVKHLLNPKSAPAPMPAAAASAAAALSSIFSGPAPAGSRPAAALSRLPNGAPAAATTPSPVPAAPVFVASSVASAPIPPRTVQPSPQPSVPAPTSAASPKTANGHDATKLKLEIMRLEGLVKKLQSELQAEREYSRSLEAHFRTFQESGN
jgi:CheY-like chemotaxis protein